MGLVYRMRVDSRGRISLPREAMGKLGLRCGDGVLLCIAGQSESCLMVFPEKTVANTLHREFVKLSC